MLGDFHDVLLVVHDFGGDDGVFVCKIDCFEIRLAHFRKLGQIHSLCAALFCEQHEFSDRHAFKEHEFDNGFAHLHVLIDRADFERFFFELLLGQRGDVDLDDAAEIGHRKQRAFVVD